jgi:RNA-splicing ligase RtcB
MKTFEGYDVKIFTDNVEESAMEQIKQLLSIDVFSNCKIRIMPDVHAGAGCVIGFTGDLGDKVIPNIVGVDIGCGMCAVKSNIKASEIPVDVMRKGILRGIRRSIPWEWIITRSPKMSNICHKVMILTAW